MHCTICHSYIPYIHTYIHTATASVSTMWVATLEFERAGNCTLAYVVIMASSYTGRVYIYPRATIVHAYMRRRLSRAWYFVAWQVIDTRVQTSRSTHPLRPGHAPLLSHSISDHRCFGLSSVSLGDKSVLPRTRRQFVSDTSTVGLSGRSFATRQDRWVTLWRYL